MSKKKIVIISIISAVFVLMLALAAVFYFIVVKPKDEPVRKDEVRVTPTLAFDQEGLKQDPFMDKNGPFYHQVYKAVSTDGINFTRTGEMIADKASVPDVVESKDGRLFIYAVDGAQRSKSGLMIAMSNDFGKTWKLGSLQMKGEVKGAADPQAVLLDDGRIRLYFLYSPTKPPLDATGKPLPSKEKSFIKSAVSTDGINFTEEAGNRFEMTQLYTDPDVVKIGNTWFMYVSSGSRNIALSSPDGMTFTEVKNIREQGSVSKTVSMGDGTYRQFYCKRGISSATTTDGLNFTGEVVSLAETQGKIICDPTPIKVGSGWLMFYKEGQVTNTVVPLPQQPPRP